MMPRLRSRRSDCCLAVRVAAWLFVIRELGRFAGFALGVLLGLLQSLYGAP